MNSLDFQKLLEDLVSCFIGVLIGLLISYFAFWRNPTLRGIRRRLGSAFTRFQNIPEPTLIAIARRYRRGWRGLIHCLMTGLVFGTAIFFRGVARAAFPAERWIGTLVITVVAALGCLLLQRIERRRLIHALETYP